jgi:hypothetical protein
MPTAYDSLLSYLRSKLRGDDHHALFVDHLLMLALLGVLSILALDLLGDGFAAFDHVISGPASTP